MERTLREKFNEKIRTKLGGLGEILTTEVNPKGLIGLGLMGVLSLGGSGGCRITPQGREFMREMGHTIIRESIKKEMGHSDYQQQRFPENVIFSDGKHYPASGYTWVNPNNQKDLRVRRIHRQTQQQNYEPPQQNNSIPQGLFIYNKHVDLNNNGRAERDELFGLEKRVFNLDKEDMTVSLYVPYTGGYVTFRTWTETGELIGETIRYSFGDEINEILSTFTGPNSKPSSPLDFMDKLKEAGPGNYKITANMEDGQTYMLDVKIIE